MVMSVIYILSELNLLKFHLNFAVNVNFVHKNNYWLNLPDSFAFILISDLQVLFFSKKIIILL